MNLCLLTLITPAAIEDVVVDWLLEQQGFTGFNSMAVNGYGLDEKNMTLSEKVTGKTYRVMFQMHMDDTLSKFILGKLKQDFPTTDIHYMITPLSHAGNLKQFVRE